MCHWHLQLREILATFCVFESQLCGSYHVSSSHLILITSCHTWDLCGSAYIFRLPEKKNFWQHFVHIGSHLCGSFHVSSSYLIFGSYDTLLTWMAINMGGSCHACNWPDQQKVFHTKCTWMTSHQSVVPLKFLQAYWYWETLATISTLEYFHMSGSELVKVPIVLLFGVSIAQKCTFFLLGSNFLLLKWPISKRKNLHPKEKKCAKRKKNAFLD